MDSRLILVHRGAIEGIDFKDKSGGDGGGSGMMIVKITVETTWPSNNTALFPAV